jgi:hypothetical protein
MLTLLPGPDDVPNNNFSQVLTGTQLTRTAKTHVHIKVHPSKLVVLIYPVHIPGGSFGPLGSKKKGKKN